MEDSKPVTLEGVEKVWSETHRMIKERESIKPITLEEVEEVWGNANFGPYLNKHKMDLIKNTLLSWASGYKSGHTAFMILVDLNLMTKKQNLTRRGKRQLWRFFKNG